MIWLGFAGGLLVGALLGAAGILYVITSAMSNVRFWR